MLRRRMQTLGFSTVSLRNQEAEPCYRPKIVGGWIYPILVLGDDGIYLILIPRKVGNFYIATKHV
jgi:hypothetical protein